MTTTKSLPGAPMPTPRDLARHFVSQLVTAAVADDLATLHQVQLAFQTQPMEDVPHVLTLTSNQINRLRALCAAHHDRWTVVSPTTIPMDVDVQEWVLAVEQVMVKDPQRFEHMQSRWEDMVQYLSRHTQVQSPRSDPDHVGQEPLTSSALALELASAAQVVVVEAVMDVDSLEHHARNLTRQALSSLWSIILGPHSSRALGSVLDRIDTPDLLPQDLPLKPDEAARIGQVYDVLLNARQAGQQAYRYPQDIDVVIALQAMHQQNMSLFVEALSEEDFIPLSIRAARLQLSLSHHAQSLRTTIKSLPSPSGSSLGLRPESLAALNQQWIAQVKSQQPALIGHKIVGPSSFSPKQPKRKEQQEKEFAFQQLCQDGLQGVTEKNEKIFNDQHKLLDVLLKTQVDQNQKETQILTDMFNSMITQKISSSQDMLNDLHHKRFSKSNQLLEELKNPSDLNRVRLEKFRVKPKDDPQKPKV